jgi:hypothetical protein
MVRRFLLSFQPRSSQQEIPMAKKNALRRQSGRVDRAIAKQLRPTIRISRRLREMRETLRAAENAVAAIVMEVECFWGNEEDEEIVKRLSLEERLKDMARELNEAVDYL